MKSLNTCPSMPNRRKWLAVLLSIGLGSIPAAAFAQQQSPSGAVETFEPVFDVGIAQRPRAGIYGITELMMAALEADIPNARQLIDAGVDVNEVDDSKSTPLMWAVHSGDVNIVTFLISRGADVHAKAFQGATALINAIAGKQEAIAIVLIEAGADPNGRGNSSRNFLEAAAESGMADVVEALIRNGADIASYGPSALSYAVSRGQKEATIVLLDAGVDANAKAAASRNSNLYAATTRGDLKFVQLLLSRGAKVDPTNHNGSPLYPAVTGGHTAIAKLLVENGAVVTAKHVLAAAQNGFADTAITLSYHLGLENLDRAEIEQLLAAAVDLGNDEFNQLLQDSPLARKVKDDAARLVALETQAAMTEHSRLLFARQVGDSCVIGIWDSRSGDSTELADIAKCPDDLFVSEDARSVFVVDESEIRILAIDRVGAAKVLPLPNLDYRTWVDQMTQRPGQSPNYQPSVAEMKPIGIGNFVDGSVGLLLSVWMPADDEYQYLLRRDDEKWTIAEERWCDRWGCENPLESMSIQSTNVWAWPESRMVWHSNVTLNPFFSGQEVEMVDLEYERYQAATHQREFEIDGVLSTLRVQTSPSEHSSTNHTFGIDLTIEGTPPKNLSGNQCLTSIVGRYILVSEFFGGRFEVTDLGTGEVVVDNLNAAVWLD